MKNLFFLLFISITTLTMVSCEVAETREVKQGNHKVIVENTTLDYYIDSVSNGESSYRSNDNIVFQDTYKKHDYIFLAVERQGELSLVSMTHSPDCKCLKPVDPFKEY